MIAQVLVILLLSVSAEARDLKVLSFNTFMLPKPIKHSLQGVRSKIIPKQLKGSDYDLMFFQEAFTKGFHRDLRKILGKEFPHTYYLENNRIIYPYFGSGLFYMSRYPFKVLDKVYFTKCTGADCFAAKGSALIEVKLPGGKVVQFANTHLQAKETAGAIRLYQAEQISRMLKKHEKAGVPQILMGDMNIDVIEPEFPLALDILNMDATELVGPIQHTNGRNNECFKKLGKDKELVDHFWVSRNSGITRSFMQVRDLNFEHKGKICPTSDHHAIEAEFEFN